MRSKLSDPAVVVVDVGGRWAVSLLAGHEGGANELALDISNVLGSEPVITTTTDATRNLLIGIGCRRGASGKSIARAVNFALDQIGAKLSQVRFLTSVDIKAGERGLIEASQELGLPLRLIASKAIRTCSREFEHSEVPRRGIGLPAVAEPSALLGGRRTSLILPKQIVDGVTVAVAQEDFSWLESAREID
jgi:cobalt-precorrin 5A hydrolase